MQKPIFISYSTDDTAVAEQVRDGLESAGIPCWVVPRDIVPGKEYAEQIIDAIEGCTVMVVSETSNTSRFVRNEVERAASKDKVIIPVRIHDVALTRSLEFFISSAQWIDALNGVQKAVNALVPAIRQHLGAGAAPIPNRQPDSRRNPMLMRRHLLHSATICLRQGPPLWARSESCRKWRLSWPRQTFAW